DLRRRHSSLRDGAKQWEAIGEEGLLGTFADLQVLINRSVAISLPIDGMKQVIWSSNGVADLKQLPPQSACVQALD
ncbi:MAG: alpha-amylase, partial [Synechococcus sp.]